MPSHGAPHASSNTNDGTTTSFLTDKSAKIFLAGHNGMLGSAIHRRLTSLGFTNLLGRTRAELDLSCEPSVRKFFDAERPRYVILAAGKVGGLHASSASPVDFMTENLRIATNVLTAARLCGSVRKLLFLASSAVYPVDAPQPIPESALLTYAIPKIVGIKMCQAYRLELGLDAIVAAPNNLYGPRDPFPSESSHVIPALIRRFHSAKVTGAGEVVVWGSGYQLREFTHADDAADAVVLLMDRYSGDEHVNVGSGREVTVRELAEMVREVVGYEGRIVWDTSRPDGVMRRRLDSSKMRAMGWEPKVELRDGLVKLYQGYLRGRVTNFKK
ncbi:hypothetical protein HU200_042875 [Digitaria exilis]|uniref:GDP-L-fucose synthase n=1 Tax=Digitaria exilis TaxID=1010633 RepID=A0A835B6C6_9POAL|nr:hypothetical protein HU200_042875 [Digitaria exilis]